MQHKVLILLIYYVGTTPHFEELGMYPNCFPLHIRVFGHQRQLMMVDRGLLLVNLEFGNCLWVELFQQLTGYFCLHPFHQR